MNLQASEHALGPKLGEGAGAEVYAWGDNEVVKLFRRGTPQGAIDHEARVTRVAFEAGAPAPEVRGIVTIGDRSGIVYPRYDGPTLLRATFTGACMPVETGAIMARLAHTIHAGCYVTSLWTFRQWTAFNLRRLRETARAPVDVLDKVERIGLALPESGHLCHGDLHADNILMTEDGPVAVDWTNALSAEPLVDVARQHLTFTQMIMDRPPREDGVEVVPGVTIPADALEAPRRDADESFIRTYAALSGTSSDELLAAIEPYMTVMAAMRIVEPRCSAEEQERLIEFIRAQPA